ncbi:uncharacterized protein KY384_007447 [Bacidia gigantensis]|uniref:uncharacterized protein n=1 Tax=Bacidia gigantensis TaxID=2732470 RepID=UPI001D04C27B|nr:uncharacterized protein KY384_007447 [Bacidia gigantensis]KAG8528529.1 hypothetical protein KY384_007447 [Bacidia gigantensis]
MGPQEKVDAEIRELDGPSQEALVGHDQEELDLIHPEKGSVLLTNPKLPQRLEAFSVICIICNRMIGNVAANAISFGIRFLQAADKPMNNFVVQGAAIAVVTFACFMHGFWRQGGIYLSNIFAVIKVAILLLIIVTGFISYSGVFKRPAAGSSNFNLHNAFHDSEPDPFGYAESFLSILFAYGGFNQANYVMAEVENPKKKQAKGADVARLFFMYTFGTVSSTGDKMAPRVLAGFMAVSSLGNLIVMPYTAARGELSSGVPVEEEALLTCLAAVKQEIAKEGVLPFRKFISRSYNVDVRKLFGKSETSIQNETPIGALILHWSLTILLILATGAQHDPTDSYRILVSLCSYVVDAFFGVCLGGGLLFLRFYGPRKWNNKSKKGAGIKSGVSVVAALLFTMTNAFPIVASWIPPSNGFAATTGSYLPWYTTPTVGWSVIICGVIYWLVFHFVVPHVGSHRGFTLRVQRTLFFRGEAEHPVQEHEQIKFEWLEDVSNGSDSGHTTEVIETRWNRQAIPTV